MCSLSGKMLIFFSLSRSVSLDLVLGHIETVRRTATRTSLLACVCFIIRLRWSLKHFQSIVESYPGSLWFRRLRYLIGPEKTPATFSVNQIKNCNQSWLGHKFAFSCASGSLLGFTMSSHRLFELPPSHLIGSRVTMVLIYNTWLKCALRFSGCFLLFFYLKEIIIIWVLNMNCFSHKFSECPKSWSQRQVGDKCNVTFWFSFSSFYSYFSLTI